MNDQWELYSNIDALTTFKIWEELQHETNLPYLQPWYDLNQELLHPILFMATHGLRIDTECLAAERNRVEHQITELELELRRTIGFPLNVNSSKQCCGYFYGILGHSPYIGKTGEQTCDDKALARLVRKGVPAARLVQRIRGLIKLTSTYLEIEYDDDGRLRSSLNITGTRTSRLSSSKTIFGTGGNMQNLPPSFRSFIVPDEGHFFIEMDKAKAEWVITAYTANEANMIAALQSGVDVHAFTGSRLYGLPIELVLTEDKAIGKSTDEEEISQKRKGLPDLAGFKLPRSMSVRQAGKKTNHACNYMMGVNEFALQNEMMPSEAAPLVNEYSKTAYPGLPTWWASVENNVALNRYVENLFGRRFYFCSSPSSKLTKAAVSTIPQATSVEVLNRGLIKIYNDQRPFMKPIRLGMQVHDSILWQYPINQLQNAVTAIKAVQAHIEPILTANNRTFKIETDLAIGLNWGDYSETNPNGMRKIPINAVGLLSALQQNVGKSFEPQTA